ncbi:MAG: flagellar hook assembly protein FlgD [Pseudomonadota bacterium]
MTTINTNQGVYNNLGLSRTNEVKTEESKEDQFMKLMIAQLQNQDPFSPQENGEFLSQLAQFDTATGISDLQNSFTSFNNTMQSNSALQASTLVGHSVLIQDSIGYLQGSEGVSGNVSLEASTNKLTIEVTDSAGQLIKTINMGQQKSGAVKFEWDGMDERGNLMPPGKYSFEANSKIGGVDVGQALSLSAKVESVSIGQYGQGLKLNLVGLNQVDFSSVSEIK